MFFQVKITNSSNSGTHPIAIPTSPYGVADPAFEKRVPVPMIARQRQAPASVNSQVKTLAAKAITSLAITKPASVMGRMAI